jgi:hypothetical protein
MPALTDEQLIELRGRGYPDWQIDQIIAAGDTNQVWQLLDQFEGERFFHQGLNSDQVKWLRAMPADQQAATLQRIKDENLAKLEGQGLTPDQIKWYNALPDDGSRWKFLGQATFGTNKPSVPGGPGPVVPPVPGGTAEQSAKALITSFLAQYGLESLGEWAWTQYQNGAPLEQIVLEMRNQPAYKARFPAMEALAQQGRAISEQQYIDYERTAASIFRAAGIPEGMYDQPEDFKNWLVGDVSTAELQERVQTYVSIALDEPNRDEMQRLYGVDIGHLAAYAMDPDRALPILERQANAALLGARSLGTGFGALSVGQLEELAGLGISPEQSVSTFSTLANLRELFNPLDQGENAIGTDAQLAAGFKGDAGAQQEIESRKQRRNAVFAQSGGFATTEAGLGGAGTAR